MAGTIVIYTGQGVAGPLTEFAFYSSDFDTCSPVVLYNTATKMGGLFHMGGQMGRKPLPSMTTDVLKVVFDAVKPTNVWLFDPGGKYTRYSESKDATVPATDVKALRKVIQSWVDLGSSGQAPVFQNREGVRNILVSLPQDAEIPTIAPAYTNTLSYPIWNAHPKGDLGTRDPPAGCLFVPGPFNPGTWQNTL